jgi:hypothetical protein
MTTIGTLLQANLDRVFNERDAALRHLAIHDLYAADATLYEQRGSYTGTEAIARAVSHLLDSLPPTLRFAPMAAAMENHDLGKLLWKGQLDDGTVVVTGTDIVRVEGDRIQSVHVFVDQP